MQIRQDRMSSRERMEALFHYQKPDRVPINMITVGFPCINMGKTITEAYDDPDTYFDAFQWTAEQYGWDMIPQCCPHSVLGIPDFGGAVRLPEGPYEGALIITSHAAESEEDVESLTLPDPKQIDHVAKSMQLSRLQSENGLPVAFVSRSPFTMATNICGLAKFSRWMIKKPELCKRLMDLALDHIFTALKWWVDIFGAQQIFVLATSPCESNQVISLKQFKTFALPYHLEYHKRLKELGINRFSLHICGDQNLNLPALAEAAPWPHPSLLSFGHEVDLEKAAEYFPKDIISGNVEPAVIQVGTPRQVYDLAKTAILKGRKAAGGFVLSAGCELPPRLPPANLYAMTKAVNDFGWYE